LSIITENAVLMLKGRIQFNVNQMMSDVYCSKAKQ